jgi:outer membrane immunogenic protein
MVGYGESSRRTEMGPVMRLVAAAASIAFAAGAYATGAWTDAWLTKVWAADYEPSDFPTLRGSAPYVPGPPRHVNWSGFYGGGQVGYGASYMDFSKAGTSINAFDSNASFTAPFGSVSNWVSLSNDTGKAANYGAFVGYNWQYDDLILGFEANYNHTDLLGSSSAQRCYNSAPSLPNCAPAITLGDGNVYDATVTATASMRITDYGTARLRAGWVADNVLPYAMIGLAIGRAEISRYATAIGAPSGAGTPFTRTEGTVNSSMLMWGYSAGLGADWLLFPNVFVRAEYEFVKFFVVSDFRSQIHNGRLGLGMRF